MKNWKKVKLQEIAEINSGTISKDFKYDTIEYVDISSVGTGTIKKPKIIKLTEAPSRAKRTIKDGSIILSTVRPNRRSFYYFKNAKKIWSYQRALQCYKQGKEFFQDFFII